MVSVRNLHEGCISRHVLDCAAEERRWSEGRPRARVITSTDHEDGGCKRSACCYAATHGSHITDAQIIAGNEGPSGAVKRTNPIDAAVELPVPGVVRLERIVRNDDIRALSDSPYVAASEIDGA